MRHAYPMTQRDLLALDRRRAVAHDRFITGRASDPCISFALDRLAGDIARADGDGAEAVELTAKPDASVGRSDKTF